MTVEDALVARLLAQCAATFGTRVYAVTTPASPAKPYAVYARTGTDRAGSLTGPSGIAFGRFRVEAWANEISDARTAFASIRQALDGWSQSHAAGPVRFCRLLSDDESFDETAQLHGVGGDFTVTYEE